MRIKKEENKTRGKLEESKAKEEEIRIKEKLDEIKDDIFQAEEEFRLLCESQYYFSKKQYHNWTV